MAATPVLPNLFVQRAFGAGNGERYDGPVVVVVRMLGGNDGLNTVVPVRDDRYYRVRPTIALARGTTLPLAGGDLGLHPSLADFMELMDAGLAGLVQGVGYPDSSRSHARATEIWETASLEPAAPATGWLGRYLDRPCDCAAVPTAGIEFGGEAGRTLASAADRSRLIGHVDLLAKMDPRAMRSVLRDGPANAAFAAVAEAQSALTDAAEQVQRAARGRGSRHDYPDTSFGRALRWTANMIETECPTRAYYMTIGSFDAGAASFDTHVDQLPKHRVLYAELGGGLRTFAEHLRKAHAFDRVVLLTFSDFGRQLAENRTQGTDHGDASVLFYAGGSIRAGLNGPMPDLGRVSNGGLGYGVDFRSIYADVLANWLGVPPAAVLGEPIEPFPIVRAYRTRGIGRTRMTGIAASRHRAVGNR